LIGTLQQGIELSEAAHTYTVLTVGDGLVTIIPSLLVSIAGGITLTRANSAGMLGGEIQQQLLAKPATLYMASLVSAALCLIPGLPKLAFLAVAAALYWGGRRSSARLQVAAPAEMGTVEKKKAEQAQGSDLASLLRLEELTLEIGFQLIPLVDEKQGGQLLSRVHSLRRHLSSEMGFLVPPVHISDNLRLKPREYIFSLRGIEIGRWQTEGTQLLAVSGDAGRRPLTGKETREPAFGVPAIWIAPALEDRAIAAGYSVVDAVTVITTHLGELIRQHACELLGRAETKRLMDSLNDSHPKLLEELVPKLLTLGEAERVLEQLLRERVSIRDLGSILEALIETAPVNKSLVALVEAARQALGRRLIRPLLDGGGQLPVLLLDPALEEEILSSLSPETGQRLLASQANPGTPLVRRLTDSVRQLIGANSAAVLPVLLCPSPARYHVKRWLEPVVPRLAVVAAGEIPPEIRLRPAGTVR
jgi:flagellar biosynthesis protein FlhA